MRLTCPNCGAQYEVPPDAIPPEGRDVQCSNCGHTWFEGATKSVAGVPVVQDDEEEADDLAEAEAWAKDPPPLAPPVPAPPPRPTVSREAAEILRAEAAREEGARSREKQAKPPDPPPAVSPLAGPQPPTASSEAPAMAASVERQRAEEARQRMARLRSEGAAPARRDRLPDVQEINSTLRPPADRPGRGAPPEARAEAPRRSGGRGLAALALVLAALALTYVLAPRIAAVAPAARPAVAAYAEAVDGARAWVEARAGDLALRLGGGGPQAATPEPGPAVQAPTASPAAPLSEPAPSTTGAPTGG